MGLVDEHAIAEEWAAALDDAELIAADCRLMCLTTAPDGPTSAHYPPGRVLVADELLGADVAATLNKPANIDKHRIVVVRDAPAGQQGRALVAAKLRHELEHARQFNAVGETAQRLSCIVDHVIAAVAGGFDDEGRAIYHAQPNERDANASDAEQRYLAAMAALGDPPYRSSEVATSYGAKDARGVSVFRESLIQKGLVWSPRRGQVDFTVPLFAEFLRENHPLASFDEA